MTEGKPLHVYYARAMDELSEADILQDDHHTTQLLQRRGLSLSNPFSGRSANAPDVFAATVLRNHQLLKNSGAVLVNLARPHYSYVGAIFEIAEAACLGYPVVAFCEDSEIKRRIYLQHYCEFICSTADAAIEYLWRCHTPEGIKLQLKEMQQYYENIASCYEEKSRTQYSEKETNGGSYEQERTDLQKRLREYCCGKTVLELGCGTGDWTRHIVQKAKSVTCTDSSASMLEAARKTLNAGPLVPSFVQADVLDRDLCFPRYDVVVAYFFLSILPPPCQATLLGRIHEWLRPKGVLLCAESQRIALLDSSGYGRRRLQFREANGRQFVLFKEHFSSLDMELLLKRNGYNVSDSIAQNKWFAFCAAMSSS